MRAAIRIFMILALLALAAGCGKGVSYGDKLDTDLKDGGSKCRLGECKSPTPASDTKVGVGAQSPSPSPVQTQVEVRYFDVSLVADAPYYDPGNRLTMPVGFTLRVTNKDTTDGRPIRSFKSDDGSFDSGRLKPGAVWTQKFDQPGSWHIVDDAAGFIYADLEVK